MDTSTTSSATHLLSQTDALGAIVRHIIDKVPSATDIVVQQDREVYVKSAAGGKPVSQILPSVPPHAIELTQVKRYLGGLALEGQPQDDGTERLPEELDDAFAATFAASLGLDSQGLERITQHPPAAMNLSFDDGISHRLRITVLYVADGSLEINIRPLPKEIRRLPKIGLPESVYHAIVTATSGIIIITGNPCTGKTGTVYSILDHIASHSMGPRVLTLEEPIENATLADRHLGVTQREVGRDVTSLTQGLRDALWQTSEIIMVSEIRDADAAEMLIDAGASGLLATATMHGNNVTNCIAKLATFASVHGPTLTKQLASTLRVIIRQALIPSKDGSENFLVFDTLLVNKKVRDFIEAEKWGELDAHLVNGDAGPDFISMNSRLADLVVAGKVELAVAERRTSQLSGNNGLKQALEYRRARPRVVPRP